MDSNRTGLVFDIQKFSLHDGPGIRDLVFLKGCPLRCQWCSNPESQSPAPEVLYRRDRCPGLDVCGLCLEACPVDAVNRDQGNRPRIDRHICDGCGRCAAVCPTSALTVVGRSMTVDALLTEVEKDDVFHSRSGGGMTVSGGEPLMQAPFVALLFAECRRRGIHTAVETTGYGSWVRLEQVARHADLIFFDLKSLDDRRHKTFTGVSNQTIKTNLYRLGQRLGQTPVVVRTPVVPGFNDSRAAIADIAAFVRELPNLQRYELLTFHRYGLSKYGYLDRDCRMAGVEASGEERMHELRRMADALVGMRNNAA